MPPKQRAALLLTDVLGWSVAEVAECLDTSVASINSALQRARATLSARNLADVPVMPTPAQVAMVDRYVSAFERYDVDALTALLRDDAILSMPPFTLWLQGHAPIRQWLEGRGNGCRGSRLVRVAACGAPAFAQYRPTPAGGHRAWAVIVLDVDGERIGAITSFLDVETLFPRFGLSLDLGA